MIAIAIDCHYQDNMMELAAFLRREIKRRGWQDSDLADRANLRRSVLSHILNKATDAPKLETLNQLAIGLSETKDEQSFWLGQLIEACGFQLPQDDDAQHIVKILTYLPELGGFVQDLEQLSSENLQRIRGYIAGLLESQR